MGDDLKRLAQTPVTKLTVGDTRFRRELATLGCLNIIEILELPLKVVDQKLNPDSNDLLDKLREKYEKDSEAFAKEVLPNLDGSACPGIGTAGIRTAGPFDASRLGRTSGPVITSRVKPISPPSTLLPRRERTSVSPLANGLSVTLPDKEWFKVLRRLNVKAGETFDDLDDRFDTVMVHMAFEALAMDLGSVREGFKALFSYYRNRHNEALALIDSRLRDVYLVYLADRARELYDGEALWPNVFGEIGVTGQTAQVAMKRLFVSQLKRRGMPRYAEDESDFYYLYTALMHGGLSEDLWANLWKKAVRPFCKELLKSTAYSSYETVALDLLGEIKNREGRYAPNNSVRKILQKVPSASVASLLASALAVAAEVDGGRMGNLGLQVLSSHGLPDTAMVALRKQLGAGANKSAGHGSTGSLIYIPEAELTLDIAAGNVLIAWPAAMLPSYLAGGIIEYIINGKLAHSEPIRYSTDKSMLPAVRIPLAPCAQYLVELRMSGDVPLGAHSQSIHRSRPGCFEFIETRRGAYRLRGAKERLTKTRKIAYLVDESLEVVPGHGMVAGSVYETDDSWGDARIQVFTVEPGAFGSIVERGTGREVAVWHESYRVHVSKDRRIGKTIEGLDLYGESPDPIGFNGGLPLITFTGLSGENPLDDLYIACDCDGARVSIARRKAVLQREDGEKEVTVRLDLGATSFPSRLVQKCVIEARQGSASGPLIYRYRFAMAPVRGFHLDGLSYSNGVYCARYSFKTVCTVDVSVGGAERSWVNTCGDYSVAVPLSDESLPVLIESVESETSIKALVDLAAIDVHIPDQLMEISGRRSICLFDALELGSSAGCISVFASERRFGRAVLIMLGDKPLFYKSMDAPGKYEINLFENPGAFVPNPRNAKSLPLSMTIWYGSSCEGLTVKQGFADIALLNCAEGLGFRDFRLYTDASFKRYLQFDSPVLCDCVIRFTGRYAAKQYGEVVAPCGSTKVEIPQAAVRALAAHRDVRALIITNDIFGGVDNRFPIELSLER